MELGLSEKPVPCHHSRCHCIYGFLTYHFIEVAVVGIMVMWDVSFVLLVLVVGITVIWDVDHYLMSDRIVSPLFVPVLGLKLRPWAFGPPLLELHSKLSNQDKNETNGIRFYDTWMIILYIYILDKNMRKTIMCWLLGWLKMPLHSRSWACCSIAWSLSLSSLFSLKKHVESLCMRKIELTQVLEGVSRH